MEVSKGLVKLNVLIQLFEIKLIRHIQAVLSEYHTIGSNKYPNIFGCPIVERANIQIYSDAQDLTNQISNMLYRPKFDQMNIQIYSDAQERISAYI